MNKNIFLSLVTAAVVGAFPQIAHTEVVQIFDGRSVVCASPLDYSTDGYRISNGTAQQNADQVHASLSVDFILCTPEGWQPRTALSSIHRKTLDGRQLEIRFKEVVLNISNSSSQLLKSIPMGDLTSVPVSFSTDVKSLLNAAELEVLEKQGSVIAQIDLNLYGVYESYVNGISMGSDFHPGGSFRVLVLIRK